MKKLISIFFLLPFVFSALNIQAFVTKFVSVSLAQNMAYSNVLLIIAGTILLLKESKPFPYTIKLWIGFFLFYYCFGLIGNILHFPEAPLLKTLIPIIYFIGFSFLLGKNEYFKLFSKVATLTLIIASLMLIYFQRINFSMDSGGIYEYELSRAGGLYGDANNAALVCLLSFVFIKNVFIPINLFQKIIKILCLAISLYALVLTFSNTGFIILLIILGLSYQRFFKPKRILFLIIIIPLAAFFLIQGALNSSFLNSIQKNRIENVINVLTLNTEQVSYSGREELLKNMMNYVNENPFIGNGVYFSTSISGHNTIIGVWADAGIFSFMFFLFLLFQHFIRALLSRVEYRYFSLSILVILTIYMITLQTVINQPYLIVLFAFIGYMITEDKIYEPLP
ncbi:O-antigen ligase family protein [Sediminicola arcticus]|uniref:O-antigen ligase family protein n=1 Tax=Sediminicola arcticus TaxID=1574308 RepID=A0ABV2SW93_9FLAO